MSEGDSGVVSVAQLGCGYWGPNLLRNLVASPSCHVERVIEPSAARQRYLAGNFPGVHLGAKPEEVLEDPSIDAVVVSTPAATHFQLALEALRAGKHCFVEKPLAMSVEECDELIAAAAAADRRLMVGHTFLYNPAVRLLRSLVESGELGSLHHLYAQRLNLGQARSDVNVLWNLAPHDVSILLHLMGGVRPSAVAGRGVSFVQENIEDVAFVTLEWDSGVVAHMHVSWLDPNRVRRVTLVGSQKMAVFDDVNEYKVAVLDRGIERVPKLGERMDFDDQPMSPQFVHRSGEVRMPLVPADEPLRVELEHFFECVLDGVEPLTNGAHARDVVAVLEAASTSMRSRGEPVAVL